MNRQLHIFVILGTGIIIGISLTLGFNLLFSAKSSDSGGHTQERKPLYWVAPMDPNYKRDQPGKSPMGMDLIPVYADDEPGSPGTVTISPDVINNLGVTTSVAERKPLRSKITTVGYVGYDENNLIHIHPRVEGWIDKLYVKAEGDPVEKGQPLYEIYSPTLVNAQEELVLALRRNNERMIQSSEERLRALRLAESTIATLKKNKQVLRTIPFFAPQSGVVDNLNVREGFYVQPGINLMSIGALDNVWVEAEVFERQADRVRKDAPVTMTLDYLPGTAWEGKVDLVHPTLDAKTRTVKVRVRLKNHDRKLKPNMFGRVTIHTDPNEDSLLVPRESVIRTGEANRVVLALGDGKFKSVEVKVGRYDESHAEILAGLEEGEEVVTSAQFLLDSESSKTSDFRRINHNSVQLEDKTAWVEATVEGINSRTREVSLNHGAIDPWDMPGMTMNFKVAETVNMSLLKTGLTLHVELRRIGEEGAFEVINVHIPQAGKTESLPEQHQSDAHDNDSHNNDSHNNDSHNNDSHNNDLHNNDSWN